MAKEIAVLILKSLSNTSSSQIRWVEELQVKLPVTFRLISLDDLELNVPALDNISGCLLLDDGLEVPLDLISFGRDWVQKYPAIKSLMIHCHKESKPIASMGPCTFIIAAALPKVKLTVAVGEDQKEIYKEFYSEPSPSDDYISDREAKVVSCAGSLNSRATVNDLQKGFQGLIKELVEWA